LSIGTMTPDGAGGFGFASGSAAAIQITIGDSNNSLTGLRDAINAAQAGVAHPVQASIISDGTGSRLVLKGTAGAASAFILTADPVDGDAGLNSFVHSPASSSMTQAATARDASLVVDGVVVSRPTNNFSDLIDGVTLDLRKAAVGTVVTIAATRDADGLKTATRDLVSALNALNSLMSGLVSVGTDTTAAGALAGDSTIRRLRAQFTALTSATTVAGATIGRLADLGIATARDGTLSIDETKLGAAVAADPDGVEKLLVTLTASSATAQGPLAVIQSELADTSSGLGSTTRYTHEQASIVSDRATLDARMTVYRATLVKQYAAMEQAVAASKSIQSFLDTQIAAWNQDSN